MKAKNLMDALNGVDFELVEQAAENRKPAGRSWRKWAAAAACAVLVLGVGAFLLFGQKAGKPPKGGTDGRLAAKLSLIPVQGEMAIEWPWEYKTPMERYPCVTLQGAIYGTRDREIGEALLGERLGVCSATGYDVYTETEYPAEFEVRAIRGVDPEYLVAVDLEGTWVVFLREELPVPATLGDWMDSCSLPENLQIGQFCTEEGYHTTGWYLADSDEILWQVLSECRDAPGRIDDTAGPGEGSYISFSVTSEALGVYKKVLTVTEDGRLFTNLMEYGCVFEIGQEAAGRILRAVTEHCTETEMEPYYRTVAGVLTEIGEGYILLDDSILCADQADGVVYRVLLDDLRARRCLEYPGDLAVGDLVVAEYSGTIDAARENTVTGAFSLTEAVLMTAGEAPGDDPDATVVFTTGYGVPE